MEYGAFIVSNQAATITSHVDHPVLVCHKASKYTNVCMVHKDHLITKSASYIQSLKAMPSKCHGTALGNYAQEHKNLLALTCSQV